MKRLFFLLLALLCLFSLCACTDKPEKTKTAESTETKSEESPKVTQDDDGVIDLGSLPITFAEKEDETKDDVPKTSTTKKPSNNDGGNSNNNDNNNSNPPDSDPSDNKDNDKDEDKLPIVGGGDGEVVETPIIPLNPRN